MQQMKSRDCKQLTFCCRSRTILFAKRTRQNRNWKPSCRMQTRNVCEVRIDPIHLRIRLVVVEDDMMYCHLHQGDRDHLAFHQVWKCTMNRHRQSSRTLDCQAVRQRTPPTVSPLQRHLHRVLGRRQDNLSEPKPHHRQSARRFLPPALDVDPRLPLDFRTVSEIFADLFHRKHLVLAVLIFEISEPCTSARKQILHFAILTCARENGSAILVVSLCVLSKRRWHPNMEATSHLAIANRRA